MIFLTKRVKHDFLDSCARIRNGSLRLHTPEGDLHDFGAGAPHAEIQLHDWSAITAMAARGDIGLGEAYVSGLWDSPSIEDVIKVALMNLDHLTDYAYPSFWAGLKYRVVDRMLRANSIKGASRNIKAHYDVGNEFYQLWLDESMTYSSALFAPGDNDLARAQTRKYDRVLSRLSAGDRVLEVGCGWGGFADRAAEQGRHVTGLTISPSQFGYADARLDGRADIRLCDYRKSEGKFDNIVSIEMVEAVGERYWPSYFSTLKNRLADDGRAVVQAITVQDSYFDIYRQSSDYIRQYTFPGGMLLSDAVISHQARTAGLKVTDNFAFGQDYARTCREWAARLSAMTAKVQALGYGDAFLRNWRYYLETCAASFEVGQTDVVQVELAHA
ncbi:SAM-dependent methyltransferase [Phaeobacter gallaeciensis]|uniref:Cyclopropane-fatty-acyl-phospholipid synthase n=1 Tax=Phaeobacter gallaeciensis TaxID=60890 RepID=A0AAD0EAB9_9RHOB|nr:cyclopropane-fatty-acyl-phospholipid synthase family protein [Phaeobacter gallaeciensis]AHD08458.1 Cyclopropane fatty acid synthase [Phaeobacter gallaeciensis DSM 26640]ATE91724.1 putative cyclopropane-fatty-acyl-phospholipid synthase [Phaeobacter gallaeciensis]ATE98452.1 putative cyclopropane-fatty-acyl-phospholipid synthase [Phaeobacter gallaeciensis]ATF00340.1 putative cyclopropane-fatty-acyl-phospholipid synthase [Phaeobacter gallaeciensis]ATF04772.1 putative cyclopropane-fatty-acyl-pho